MCLNLKGNLFVVNMTFKFLDAVQLSALWVDVLGAAYSRRRNSWVVTIQLLRQKQV